MMRLFKFTRNQLQLWKDNPVVVSNLDREVVRVATLQDLHNKEIHNLEPGYIDGKLCFLQKARVTLALNFISRAWGEEFKVLIGRGKSLEKAELQAELEKTQ